MTEWESGEEMRGGRVHVFLFLCGCQSENVSVCECDRERGKREWDGDLNKREEIKARVCVCLFPRSNASDIAQLCHLSDSISIGHVCLPWLRKQGQGLPFNLPVVSYSLHSSLFGIFFFCAVSYSLDPTLMLALLPQTFPVSACLNGANKSCLFMYVQSVLLLQSPLCALSHLPLSFPLVSPALVDAECHVWAHVRAQRP